MRRGALLESLRLCEVGWALVTHLRCPLCGKGLAMVQHLLAGGRGRDILPFAAVPEPTKAETELSMTCARGQQVSPELIQEGAVESWIRCRQVVVIAWCKFVARYAMRLHSNGLQLLTQHIEDQLMTTEIETAVREEGRAHDHLD